MNAWRSSEVKEQREVEFQLLISKAISYKLFNEPNVGQDRSGEKRLCVYDSYLLTHDNF